MIRKAGFRGNHVRGMSLVEVLVVVGIIGILASIGQAQYFDEMETACGSYL